MKQTTKDKLLAFADDLDNKGLPDEAKELREIVSSEEINEDADTTNTDEGGEEGGEEDGGDGENGGNHPPGKGGN